MVQTAFLIIIILALTRPLLGQQLPPKDGLDLPSATQPHTHVATDQVDGSVHPELVPDVTAYRLFFLVVGIKPDASPSEKSMQSAQLKRLGFDDRDAQSLIAILQSYREKYDELIKNYNATVPATASGFAPDINNFLAQRDSLVQNTLDTLKVQLSPTAFSHLAIFVKAEKTRMKISRGNQIVQ